MNAAESSPLGNTDATPRGRSERHLAPVSSPAKRLNRQNQSFIPVYTELFRTGPDARGRRGYGLSGNVAVFFSTLVHLQGSPADGRRQTRNELEGKEKFTPRPLSAGALTRAYGWTYDEIQSWAETCSKPHACPHCDRAHPLLRVERRIGHRNQYALVHCEDLGDSECVPVSVAVRAKRTPTGAADPTTRMLRNDSQAALPLDGLQTLGQSPKVRQDTAGQTLGESPKVRVETPGSAASTKLVDLSGEPATDHDARVLVLRGFAKLEGASIAPESIAELATLVQQPDQLHDALVYVIAAASIEHAPITPAFVVAALEKRLGTVEQPAEDVRGAEWGTARIHELARHAEPRTSLAQAKALRDEFYARCITHVGGDAALAEDELARIVTDRRICGGAGVDPPQKPIAMLRDGFKKGWIWTPSHEDDGSGQLHRAFERLALGDQAVIEQIFRSADRSRLDYARLRRHGVTSKQMIAYLRQRFSASP